MHVATTAMNAGNSPRTAHATMKAPSFIYPRAATPNHLSRSALTRPAAVSSRERGRHLPGSS